MPFRAKDANYNALRKLSIRRRLEAASDVSMGQMMVSMLTPTQAAELFPKYYLQRYPDISGFIKAIPSSLSAMRQREIENQIENTASGSSAGANYAAGGYRKKWQEEVDRERQRTTVTRKGEAPPPPQLTIEQRQSFDALKAGDIDINDKRMQWLKNAPEDVRKQVGIGIIEDEKGGKRFHYTPPSATEEEAKQSLASGWKGGAFKASDYASVLRQAGFREQDIPLMTAVGIRESNHNVRAYNPGKNTPETSIGLFQINTRSNAHPLGSPELNYAGVRSLEDLNDPVKNAKVAYYLYYKTDRGIKHWGGFTDGGYRQYLNEAQAGYAASSGKGFTGADPLTQNYGPEKIAAQQRELVSQKEAANLGKLAAVTQPGGPVNAAGPAASIPEYAGNVPDKFGVNRQCVSLSKHFAPNLPAASKWNVSYDPSGSNIKPGAIIATTTYGQNGDRIPDGRRFPGGEMAKRLGGTSYYHTGVALTAPDEKGNVVILEQYASHGPKVRTVNIHDYNGKGTRMGLVAGGEPTEQSLKAIAYGKKLAEPHELAMINAGTTFPAARASSSETNQPVIDVPAPKQERTDTIKPLSEITQPGGPVNAAGPTTPMTEPGKTAGAPAAPSASPERYKVDTEKFVEAIRGTAEFKSRAGLFGGMVPASTIISGFNDDPRVKAAGVRLDEKGIMHFDKGMTPEAKNTMADFKSENFMTKIEEKKKETAKTEPPKPEPAKVEPSKPAESKQEPPKPATTPAPAPKQEAAKVEPPKPVKTAKAEDTPTKVPSRASGGPVEMNTEKIAAYPIGGLRGDNAVVVNAHQEPLFTMNTNEGIVKAPGDNKAQVIPNNKDLNVSPTPKTDMASGMMEEFNSVVNEMKQDFASNKPKDIQTKVTDMTIPNMVEPTWLAKMGQSSAESFQSPTARRVAYRSAGMETGEPNTGFHYSHRNNS